MQRHYVCRLPALEIEASIVTAADPLGSSVTATASHPTLSFASTGIRHLDGQFFIDRNLTIRGATKPVTLQVEPPEFGPSPQGGTKAGFSATTEINRNDFGVSYNGPIPGGGMALGDKVQIVLEIEADLLEMSSP